MKALATLDAASSSSKKVEDPPAQTL
jgi:hypothetical protein